MSTAKKPESVPAPKRQEGERSFNEALKKVWSAPPAPKVAKKVEKKKSGG